MPKRGRITVVTQGGLCNRLRVLFSALHFAENQECVAQIEWAKNKECFARFDDLFEPIQSSWCVVKEEPWWHRPVSRKNLHIPALLRLPFYDKQIKNFHPQRHGSLEQYTQNNPRLYVSTGYSLTEYPPTIVSRLRPTWRLMEVIEKQVKEFSRYTVGVHIRRTDNVMAIEESPIALFIAAMEQELKEKPHVKFYLATDDADIKQQLLSKFRDVIITRPAAVRRDTCFGMEEAVVDLFCLSRTQKLLGSYWSSFTDMAAELGNVPVIIVKRKE